MKSLSILILLGTTTALVIGGLFFVTPALAETTPQNITNEALVAAPAALEAVAEVVEPVAPATGGVAIALEVAAPSNLDPGLALSSTFAVNLEKDTASATVEQAASLANSQPVANSQAQAEAAPQSANSLESFIASLENGNSSQIVGLYVDGLLAAKVGGQGGNAAYVTSNPSEVTRFGMASDYGSQGFLAHNYLLGATFSSLGSGQIITVIYGDGSSQDYRVQTVRSFQALSPNSTQSNFVDLDNGGNLSASELFYQIYNSDNPVVLQTCIANEGISTWGRLFVIAVPVS